MNNHEIIFMIPGKHNPQEENVRGIPIKSVHSWFDSSFE